MHAKASPFRRSGAGVIVLALHVLIIYVIAISLGVAPAPQFAKEMQAVIIDQPQEQPVQPVVKPDLSEPQLDVPIPETIPEIPVEVPVETPPPADAIASAPTESAPEVANLQVTRRVEPVYPAASRRLGEEGTAMFRVLVNPSGRPESVEMLKSSGHPRLDQAALEAIRKWMFNPAKQNGQAVQSWTRVQVAFRLETR